MFEKLLAGIVYAGIAAVVWHLLSVTVFYDSPKGGRVTVERYCDADCKAEEAADARMYRWDGARR